jgi:hypothetical protein
MRTNSGVAEFEFNVDVAKLKITKETGMVLIGQAANPAGMLARWHDYDSRCRAGAGNSLETGQACKVLEHTSKSLSAAGWCYGSQTDHGYEMEWYPCEDIESAGTVAVKDPSEGEDASRAQVPTRNPRSNCFMFNGKQACD